VSGLFTGVDLTSGSVIVGFEDLPLAPESFYNGSDGAGGFTSGGAFFNNTFDPGFVAWWGWSYSNVTDNTTPGYANQYSAIPGNGAGGSSNYAVAFAWLPGDATIELPTALFPESILVTNTTYAYLSMLHGDDFAKKFGGLTGDDPDYFLLTITGRDAAGGAVGTVEVYLADYRFEDNASDYRLDTWTEVDLSALHGATRLSFGLESTDVGQGGMNTPAYFAVDNLRLVPEPTMLVLIAVGAVALLRRRARH
jgi:hypothetical protein